MQDNHSHEAESDAPTLFDYEIKTFFDALAKTIVKTYPKSNEQQRFLEALRNSHMEIANSETEDDDDYRQRKDVLKHLHLLLSDTVEKFRDRS